MAFSATAIRDKVLTAITNTGSVSWTVTVYTDTLNANGTVASRSGASHSIVASPFLPDSPGKDLDISARPRQVGAVYVPSKNLPFTPAAGQRWVVGGKAFTATAVDETTASGLSLVWAVRLSEGAAA